MKPYDSIVFDLRNSMRDEPGDNLRGRILESAASEPVAPHNTKRRRAVRPVLAAVIIAALTATSVFAATTLPGFIRSLTAGDMTVNQFQRGALHEIYVVHEDIFGVFTIGRDILNPMSYGYKNLDSLEEAQKVLGAPLLIPTHLEDGETPYRIRKGWHNLGESIIVDYCYWFIEEETGGPVFPGGKFFTLAQTYVGDKQVTFDVDDSMRAMTIKGYEAVWLGNGGLYWIQDSVLVQLLPCGLDRDYVIRIAEGLRAME
jgi:hypothetical protein